MAEEGDAGGNEELPAIVASIESDQVTLTDTQLVMEDDDGNMPVYPEPEDILGVLSRTIHRSNSRHARTSPSISRTWAPNS